MLRAWRPPYDRLHHSPYRKRTPHADRRFLPAVHSLAGCARRLPERSSLELADLSGNRRRLARAIRARSAAPSTLLEVAEIFRPRRLRIFLHLQRARLVLVVAARAQHAAALSARGARFLADRRSAGRTGCRKQM